MHPDIQTAEEFCLLWEVGLLMKDFFKLYDALASSVSSEEKIVSSFHGECWSMCETETASGIAMFTEGCSIDPVYPAGLCGMTLESAAAAVKSWNYEEASAAMAAVNCALNTCERMEQLNCAEPYDNYCTAELDFSGAVIGVVGHMGGPLKYKDTAEKIYVMERAPKPGDYPDPACEVLLPQCDYVFMTGNTICNKTLPHLLELSRSAYVILVGPSVPMCPELLEFGIDRLSGMAVVQRDEMRSRVISGEHGNPYVFGNSFLLKK